MVTVDTRDSHVKRQKTLHVTHVVGKKHFAKMCNSKDKKGHILLDNYSEEIFVLAGKNDATLELFLESNQLLVKKHFIKIAIRKWRHSFQNCVSCKTVLHCKKQNMYDSQKNLN